MELVTLDSSYQPSELVERYSSLLWTERYSTVGDFQLTTTDIQRTISLLPLESMVSLRETTVPMLVEVYKIEKKINSAPMLTVTGRSFDSVLERRASVMTEVPRSSGPRVIWIESRNSSSDAAYQAIRKIIGDVAAATDTTSLPAQSPILSVNDAFPMVSLTMPYDYSPLTTNKYEINPGNLYTVAMELITANHHGLKSVRPDHGSNKIGLEIYNGSDLTNEIVFDAKFDQFEDATYLLSDAGSVNWAYVFSKTGNSAISKVKITPPAQEPSGLERKVLYLDTASEEGTDTAEIRNTRGLMEMYKFNSTAIFDGQVSEQVAAGYIHDYSLGDIIRLDGEYGLSENVRVTEFIRSSDSTGNKAYPTFEVATA